MLLFMDSLHFNQGTNAAELKRLCEVILATAPDFEESRLDKRIVYPQIFPDEKVVLGKLEKTMADLNKLLRIYAVTQQYLSPEREEGQMLDWAKWLRERGLGERARHIITKIKAPKEREATESLEQYRAAFLVAEEEHEWESTHNQFKGDLNIPNLLFRLETFYQNYEIELKNRYLLQQKATQLPSLESRSEEIEKGNLLEISKKIYALLESETPSVEDFQELLQILKTKEKYLSFQALAQFYAYLRGSCTLLINGGNLNFIPILHEIHQDNLERGYFFLNGEISPNSYVNLVQIATRAKDYEWAKKFTNEYSGNIIGGDSDQFFLGLNMAQCLFAEGQFNEALNWIPDGSSGSHYHHHARRLELKIYYELNSDLLLYKIDAFRKFIGRTAPKTIASNLGGMNLNFLNILLQLSQSPIKDKARSARLLKRIEEKKLLADRAWLLEKARELG